MFKGHHFDEPVIPLSVRWYLVYNLSLPDLKVMIAERGIALDHAKVHRWVLHFSPSCLTASIGENTRSHGNGTSTRLMVRFALCLGGMRMSTRQVRKGESS